MSKQFRRQVGLAALFVGCFAVLNWVYGYVITFQSGTNDCFFMFGRPFFLEFFDHPAGGLRYAGRFLGQFLSLPVGGSADRVGRDLGLWPAVLSGSGETPAAGFHRFHLQSFDSVRAALDSADVLRLRALRHAGALFELWGIFGVSVVAWNWVEKGLRVSGDSDSLFSGGSLCLVFCGLDPGIRIDRASEALGGCF